MSGFIDAIVDPLSPAHAICPLSRAKPGPECRAAFDTRAGDAATRHPRQAAKVGSRHATIHPDRVRYAEAPRAENTYVDVQAI